MDLLGVSTISASIITIGRESIMECSKSTLDGSVLANLHRVAGVSARLGDTT